MNAALVSSITDRNLGGNGAKVELRVLSLNNVPSYKSIYYLGAVKASVTRQLPEAPTHWTLHNTKDYPDWTPPKISSRGKLRTWAQDYVWYYDDRSYDGYMRNESGIEGDPEKNWGAITVELQSKVKPLRTSVVEVDELSSSTFNDLTIGRPVSFNALGMYITGYVLSRKISGGQTTVYSVKVQPDHFYNEGEDVTADWM